MQINFLKQLMCFLSFIFLQHTVFAQEDEGSKIWSLETCIEYAIENNLTIRQNTLQQRTTENNLIQSRAGRYPTVNASAQQSFNFGRSIDPFTNSFVNETIRANQFSITANMNLFNGFQQQNTIMQNELNVEVNELNVESAKNDITLNIALAYLQILLNQELLEATEKQVQASKTQLERTQKLYDAGAIAINDVVNLEAQIANEELNIVTAQNQLELSKLNLQQQMNLPLEENFALEPITLGEIEATPYPASPQEIFEIAESTQPSVQSADLSIRSNEIAVDIAKGGLYPSLNLIATVGSGYSSARTLFNTQTIEQTQVIGTVDGTGQTVSTNVPVTSRTAEDYPFTRQVGDNFNQAVILRLTVPIFNGKQVETNISNQVIAVENSKITSENVRLQLRQDIEQAYINSIAAINTYEAQKQQVDALELALETSERRLNAGAGNAVDYNVAKINFDRANSDLIRAKYEYIFRIKVLDFYQNLPLSLEDLPVIEEGEE